MASQIPVQLKGANLGERHRHLNSLVTNAYNVGEPIETIITIPESSTIDRLFKIDLASKHKHIEYILKNLQDEDMLYVSRALKSKWLLDDGYRHIMNPGNLEEVLYPQMITTAVNKMKHWIHLNLRDSGRCHEFYEYYLEKNDNYAFKFLCKCTEEIIFKEFSREQTLAKMTPQKLKILCEKAPSIARLYFETLTKNKFLLKEYTARDYNYFKSLICVLKIDIDTFLDITEQHFMPHFPRLSPISTKFIITQRKDRFMKKPELYTARLLNVHTIAQYLNQDECEELVLKLARAQYLSDEHWFNYKNVEPLVKRLPVDKRASFKKKVFVDKDVGELVADWPYALPASLFHSLKNDDNDVFLDKEENPAEYDAIIEPYSGRAMPCALQAAAPFRDQRCINPVFPKQKTLLDTLFDEYRFMSFNKTLLELRKKIKSESSSQNRMYMMLVLVSKSGGKEENLNDLFHLLMEHRNEPCQVRSAVIRSFIKRVCVWRVNEDIWNQLLIFGQGLGLDGSTPNADCDEGLHAVVIRTLLSDHDCSSAIKASFIKKFSTLVKYPLTTTEKNHIKNALLTMLLESANAEVNPQTTAQILVHAIDTIQDYKIKIETRPDFITSIKNLVTNDQTAARRILQRLFNLKLGRKELFRENFELIQTDASYMNALKHDTKILSVDAFIKAVVSNDMHAEQFLRKTSIYFSGNDDLASRFLTAITNAKIHKRLARPLAYLIGDDLKSYMLKLDTSDEDVKRFSASIRANAHVARPAFSIDSLEWRQNGAKLIANRVLKCKAADIDSIIKQLLTWKRTARLAIVLSQRTSYEADIFAAVSKIRPTIALKTALTYFRRRGDKSDPRIWSIVKPLIVQVKVSIKKSHHLLRSIKKVESVPLSIRPEYATEVYKVIYEIDFYQSLSVMCHIMLLLPNVEENFVETALRDFFENQFSEEKEKDRYNYMYEKSNALYFKVCCRYLLLCKTEETQNRRFRKVGVMYLSGLLACWDSGPKKRFFDLLNIFVHSFKYNKVFFNEEYISCIPVIEKIIQWMHSILPMEKYFASYVPVHLTISYKKAIRRLLKQVPEMLTNKQMRCNEGYKIFGVIFGKLIGQEARLLSRIYYDSIIELYSVGFNNYIRFICNGSFRMVPYIIKGIIEVSIGIECLLAVSLNNNLYFHFTADEKKEIAKCFNENNQIEMQFLIADRSLLVAQRFAFLPA